MIRINGVFIDNCPDETINKDDMLMGELNSAALSFIKTPIHIYGRNTDELVKYAKDVKTLDDSYDTLDIYSEYYDGERDFIASRNIQTN